MLNEGVGGNSWLLLPWDTEHTCHRQVASHVPQLAAAPMGHRVHVPQTSGSHVPCCCISMRHRSNSVLKFLCSCSEQYSSWERRVLVCARV